MQHTHWILTRPLTHPLSPLFANSLTPWLILSFTYLFSRPLVNALVLFHQLVLLLTHPFSRSSTRSPAHQSVLSFTHPPTHPFSRSLSRSLAQLPVLALTHPFSCSSIRSLAHPPTRSPAHPPVLSLTHPPVLLLIHPFSRSPTCYLAHPPVLSLIHLFHISMQAAENAVCGSAVLGAHRLSVRFVRMGSS